MVSTALPVLVTVTDWFALTVLISCGPKERVEGERLTAGTPTPVPLKLTVWGLPLALSVMLTDALRDPVAAGSNFTLIVQLAPAATLLPHVFVWVKSAVFVPVRPTLVMFKVALPVLVSVALWAALVVPTFCEPKERLEGDRLTEGAGGGGEELPPPPPQATQAPTTKNAATISQTGERRVTMVASVARISNPDNSQNKATEGPNPGGSLRCRVGSVALDEAAVVTVSVAVAPEEPVRVTDDRENAQPMLVSEGVQPRVTVPVKPATGVMVIVEVPDCPGAGIAMVAGIDETLKSATLIVTAGDVVELK